MLNNGARLLRQMFERPKQEAIAKRIGVGPSYLSLLASGSRKPSRAVAEKIEKELGIPVEAWTR